MTTDQTTSTVSTDSVEQLESIAQRLVEIHVALASNLDGSRETQTWTRHKIEALMAYVDSAIDGQMRHVA